MLRRWPVRQGGYHASAECVGVLAWVVCPTGAAIASNVAANTLYVLEEEDVWKIGVLVDA